MGLFKQKPSADLDSLRAELADLRYRLDVSEHAKARLDDRISALDATTSMLSNSHGGPSPLDALSARIDRVAELASAPAQPDHELTARLDQLATGTEQMAQLAERVAMSANDARVAREQAAVLEQRIASVSTELANQLSELGKEIDGLSAREENVAGGAEPEVVEALRSGQVKLASEQARYEIAFREDLASLAEQLRHLRGR